MGSFGGGNTGQSRFSSPYTHLVSCDQLLNDQVHHEGDGKRDQEYHGFLILFKSSGKSAKVEKNGIRVMKPPSNDHESGSGHDGNCFIYYVFMHKDLQEFWKTNTKLEGSKRRKLLQRLENKY